MRIPTRVRKAPKKAAMLSPLPTRKERREQPQTALKTGRDSLRKSGAGAINTFRPKRAIHGKGQSKKDVRTKTECRNSEIGMEDQHNNLRHTLSRSNKKRAYSVC